MPVVVSVTADSNVWISSFNFSGKPRVLIGLADEGEIRLDVSEEIILEVLRVLRVKFKWGDERLRAAELDMNTLGNKVVPSETLHLVKDDEADNRILECAAEAHSRFVVTGDKHLLRLGLFGSVPILKVADFLDIVSAGSRGDS